VELEVERTEIAVPIERRLLADSERFHDPDLRGELVESSSAIGPAVLDAPLAPE
jgi:hypothetical protein